MTRRGTPLRFNPWLQRLQFVFTVKVRAACGQYLMLRPGPRSITLVPRKARLTKASSLECVVLRFDAPRKGTASFQPRKLCPFLPLSSGARSEFMNHNSLLSSKPSSKAASCRNSTISSSSRLFKAPTQKQRW